MRQVPGTNLAQGQQEPLRGHRNAGSGAENPGDPSVSSPTALSLVMKTPTNHWHLQVPSVNATLIRAHEAGALLASITQRHKQRPRPVTAFQHSLHKHHQALFCARYVLPNCRFDLNFHPLKPNQVILPVSSVAKPRGTGAARQDDRGC